MRTALVLLLLLALAAIPGSVIPQSGVDSLKTSRWQDAHPQLTPIYERLGLFAVYDSPWFSAIYLLLMLSLVGCIVPAHDRLREGDAGGTARGPPQPGPAARPRRPTGPTTRRPRCSTQARDRPAEAVATGVVATPVAADGRRRGQRGARLPARGRQPGLPPLGARRAGRLRARWAVRLQGRRDPRRRQRLLQQPHAVRRLRAGQPLQGRRHGAVLLRHRVLRRRVAHRRAAQGDGPGVQRATSSTARRRARPTQPTTCRSTTR